MNTHEPTTQLKSQNITNMLHLREYPYALAPYCLPPKGH